MSRKFTIYMLILAMVCLLIVLNVSCVRQSGSIGLKQTTIVNVDDFAADPGAYSGVIAISGVVSYIKPENAVFGIIDTREYELCGVVTCAANEIPISVPSSRFSGELPEVEDEVLVYGKIVNSADGYVLDALRVERGSKVIMKQESN